MARKKSTSSEAAALKGWAAIARHLGQPVTIAQHWAKEGMPVKKEGRFVTASPESLSAWLGRESHAPAPVHIAADAGDLTAELRRGLSAARRHRRR